jgi:hypothetical protein
MLTLLRDCLYPAIRNSIQGLTATVVSSQQQQQQNSEEAPAAVAVAAECSEGASQSTLHRWRRALGTAIDKHNNRHEAWELGKSFTLTHWSSVVHACIDIHLAVERKHTLLYEGLDKADNLPENVRLMRYMYNRMRPRDVAAASLEMIMDRVTRSIVCGPESSGKTAWVGKLKQACIWRNYSAFPCKDALERKYGCLNQTVVERASRSLWPMHAIAQSDLLMLYLTHEPELHLMHQITELAPSCGYVQWLRAILPHSQRAGGIFPDGVTTDAQEDYEITGEEEQRQRHEQGDSANLVTRHADALLDLVNQQQQQQQQQQQHGDRDGKRPRLQQSELYSTLEERMRREGSVITNSNAYDCVFFVVTDERTPKNMRAIADAFDRLVSLLAVYDCYRNISSDASGGRAIAKPLFKLIIHRVGRQQNDDSSFLPMMLHESCVSLQRIEEYVRFTPHLALDMNYDITGRYCKIVETLDDMTKHACKRAEMFRAARASSTKPLSNDVLLAMASMDK